MTLASTPQTDVRPKPPAKADGPFHLLRLTISAVLLWAGVAKARAPHLFAEDIAQFQIMPSRAAVLALAIYLPYLEIVCALGLLTRRWRSGALLLGTALMGIFTIALLSAWARGLTLTCGCFGATGGPNAAATNYPFDLARDLLLGGACLFCWKRLRG